ncbi:MAG: S8 family serine peptidase [Candidatus Thorarchaeota archaeon]
MEGLSTMLAIPKSLTRQFAAFVIFILLFTPMTIFVGGAKNTSGADTLIGPSLASAILSSESNDVLPVVAQFPEGSTPDAMINEIQKSNLQSIEIRYAFKLIPMVSLYIGSGDVEELAKSTYISGLILDRNRQILVENEPVEDYVIAQNGNGYVHFDTITGADLMWDEGFNGSGVTVAILDSGIDGNHPDLENRLIGFKDLINSNDDMQPSDGVDAYDDNGHGTACAWNAVGDGTASGGNITGIAPGANLLGVKVLDATGSGDDSVIARGIEFAVLQGVDVISISLGGEWTDNTFVIEPSVAEIKTAISSGVSVVVAAGNSGPAAFTINSPGIVEEAITVGSSYSASGVIAFSSVGPVYRTISSPKGYVVKPDLVAPGYQVVSGRGAGVNTIEYPVYNFTQFGSYYTQWSGTSASTPIVAGLVAILHQKYLLLTPIEAKAALMKSATDLGVDSMSQGWGLANVSRASFLLTNSSRDITLMTPRSFPTLPWSSQVLIVGDERPPLNVTVISTQPIGIANITLTGNATQFIETSVDQLSVVVGYSHFGLALEVPEDLPVSAAGFYSGHLNLTHNGDIVSSIEIGFSVSLFGGRMMVDMEHHETGGLNPDIDDPSYYGYFTEYLRDRGMVVSEFGSPEDLRRSYIDLSTISSADVFTIMDTETTYTASEVTALHDFVENGGTLLVLSESFSQETGEPTFAIDSYNQILEPFGIQCEERAIGFGPGNFGIPYGANYSGYVENDPLMDGVYNLYVLQGSTLHVDSSVSNAKGLLWEDSERTHAIVATAEYGSGKVFVISDGSTLYDDVLYDAINSGADNLRLLRNLANAITPDSPRIFDVAFEFGNLGDPANVTAFVFDDDLESVSMSVIGPIGNNLTGLVTEELGYKFSTSFTFSSGGFYSVQVVATDSAGNIRIFQKVILIPVDAADDLIVLSVIYTLLGVVGVGLAYVLIARRSGRPKPPPRPSVEPKEDEWELPPPSIE